MFIFAKTKTGTSCVINSDYIVEIYPQSDGTYRALLLPDENHGNDFHYVISAEDFTKLITVNGFHND